MRDKDSMGGWVRENDGDLNPSLLLYTITGGVNIAVAVSAVVLAFQHPVMAVPLLGLASLCTLGALTCFGIGWYKAARAKLLANSKVLQATQRSLGAFANYDRDERDDDQIAAMEGRLGDR